MELLPRQSRSDGGLGGMAFVTAGSPRASLAASPAASGREWKKSGVVVAAVREGERVGLRRAPYAPRPFIAHACGLGLAGLQLRRMLRASARRGRACFRANRLKAGPDLLARLRAAGWRLSPGPWCGDGFLLEGAKGEAARGQSRPHLTGEVYFQEATSMLPVAGLHFTIETLRTSLVELAQGRRLQVLDLCAAPGSKTTQLGAWLASAGLPEPPLLVANEPDQERFRTLRQNLLRTGTVNFLLSRGGGQDVGDLAPGCFDLVLVDAPCSGEGTVRKFPEVLRSWAESDFPRRTQRRAALQWDLVCSGWRALRPGGFLVYSTCTLNEHENEAVCRRLLSAQPSARPLDLRPLLPGAAAGPAAGVGAAAAAGAIRMWPHLLDTEGFFVSCFRKESPHAAGGHAVEAAAGESGSGWEKGRQLRPLDGAAARELRVCLSARNLSRGLRPELIGRLRVDAEGCVWLAASGLPGGEGLLRRVEEPGIPVARRTPHGLEPTDEFALFAGAELSDGELLGALARVESSVSSRSMSMDAHAGKGQVAEAEQCLREMRLQGLQPNIVSLNTMLKAHAKARDPDGAAARFADLRRWKLEPDLVSYSTLVEAYASRGMARKAEDVVAEMRAASVRPDVALYASLMGAHAARGDAAGASRVFSELLADKLKPNAMAYTVLVKAHAKASDSTAASGVLQDMRGRGLNPDQRLFHAVAASYARAGDLERTRELLQGMQSRRFRPNAVTFNTLLSAHVQCKDNVGAARTFADMSSARVEPDAISFVSLMKAHARAGDVAGVEAAFEAMGASRLEPNALSLRVLEAARATA